MKPIEIAKLLNISRQRVNYWVHHEYQQFHPIQKNLNEKDRKMIKRWKYRKSTNEG